MEEEDIEIKERAKKVRRILKPKEDKIRNAIKALRKI